jgi:hypothetical protein
VLTDSRATHSFNSTYLTQTLVSISTPRQSYVLELGGMDINLGVAWLRKLGKV